MIVKIVVTDKRLGKIEIPITKDQVSYLYEITLLYPEFLYRFNTKKFKNLCKKLLHLGQDVVNQGKVFVSRPSPDGAVVEEKDYKYYHIGPPKWKKY